MKKNLFAHPYYASLAPVFGHILKMGVVVWLGLLLTMGYLTYISIDSLTEALATQDRLQEKSQNIQNPEHKSLVKDADISRFNRDLAQLRRIIPTVSISPLIVLELVEKLMPADTRLQSFEYNRASAEVFLKLQAQDKASIQDFVFLLEKSKKFTDIQMNEGRQKEANYTHNVVLRI